MGKYGFSDKYPVADIKYDGFNQYQDFTATTDKAGSCLNTVLGLMGECGEIAEKVKKITRDVSSDYPHGIDTVDFSCYPFTDAERLELAKEVGDVLWYASRLAGRLGYRLGDIMRLNVEKLSSRKDRDVLHGSGDNR